MSSHSQACITPNNYSPAKKNRLTTTDKKIRRFHHRSLFYLSVSFGSDNRWEPTDLQLGVTQPDYLSKNVFFLNFKGLKLMYYLIHNNPTSLHQTNDFKMVSCRMSILRNCRVVLSNFRVKGHYIYTGFQQARCNLLLNPLMQ